MLVLSRKAGQELVIGDNIRITINKLSGNRVTIGIDAPDDIRIVRGELEKIVRSFDEAEPLEAPHRAPQTGVVIESDASSDIIEHMI